MGMPTFDQLMQPTLIALETLGGSGSNDEIATEVIRLLDLPESITSVMQDSGKSSQTKVEYRLGWARTYLKKYGLITNSARGIWAFTPQYQKGLQIDPAKIVQAARESADLNSVRSCQQVTRVGDADISSAELEESCEMHWKERLHQTLLELSPDAFERLAKRLLRESGFVQVEVTGRTGDGGIDGKGILRLQNIISYSVVFQCKRYRDSVGSGDIRNFRGAMAGRADKGIFITTGTFTRAAIDEAAREGTDRIDLIDGDDLADMLKSLQLGVTVELVEQVDIDTEWFKGI